MSLSLKERLDSARARWLELSVAERPSFLEQLRDTDPEVARALTGQVRDLADSGDTLTDDLLSRASTGDGASSAVGTDAVPDSLGGYPVEEEIGRGGMGVVYRVVDPRFERRVALKRMLPDSAKDADSRARFLGEAKLTGQLQHPGIPPAYQLGELEDSSPFFVLKLIDGETLSDLLRRLGPGASPRALDVFSRVCETVAFAHSRGVIHRDLKPGNVMVGAHGEVQVMDWGIAKSSSDLAEEQDEEIGDGDELASSILADHAISRTGRVLGTPGYMAPEQARGEVRSLDARCDVFGLGAILCRMLTGSIPFSGPTTNELLEQTRKADLDDAFGRLDGCGADPELVALCKRCLAPKKGKRPANAGELAAAVAKYESALSERARKAELARAEAEGRVDEEQRRLRWTIVAAFAVLLLVIGAGVALTWYQQEQARHEAERVQRRQAIEDGLDRADQLRVELHKQLARRGGVFELLDAPSEWQARIQSVEEPWQRAQLLASSHDVGADTSRGIAGLGDSLKRDRADYTLATSLERVREGKAVYVEGIVDLLAAGDRYARAFSTAGVDVLGSSVDEVVRHFRGSPIREQVAVALDDWALSLTYKSDRESVAERQKLIGRLLTISRRIDPDPWMAKLRRAEVWSNARALLDLLAEAERLASKESKRRLSAHTYYLLGELLGNKEHVDAWSRRGQALYPDDFWLAYQLGGRLLKRDRPRDALGYFRVALSSRPKNAVASTALGTALKNSGDLRGASESYRLALEQDPEYLPALFNLGLTLKEMGELDASIESYRAALALETKFAVVHNGLGVSLHAKREYGEAVRAFRKATTLDPFNSGFFNNLGLALGDDGQLDEARRAYDKALELDPKNSLAHNGLGLVFRKKKDLPAALDSFRKAVAIDAKNSKARFNLALTYQDLKMLDEAESAYVALLEGEPKNVRALTNLGNVMKAKGKPDEAVRRYRQAIAIDPKRASAHYNLARTLQGQGDTEGAVAEYRTAVKLDPTNAEAFNNLGVALNRLRKLNEAIEAYRSSLAIDPKAATVHNNLGLVWKDKGDIDAALAAFREAIRHRPRYALAHANLGMTLRSKGEFAESAAALEKATSLVPARHPLRRQFAAQAARSTAYLRIEKRLGSILKGEDTNAREQLEAAKMCQMYLERQADAVRLYRAAFEADPRLAVGNRYNAACAALTATEGEKAEMRALALGWLRTDLEAQRKLLADPKQKSKALSQLRYWLTDGDLASVREPAALEKLPKEERKKWHQLWEEVAGVLERGCGSAGARERAFICGRRIALVGEPRCPLSGKPRLRLRAKRRNGMNTRPRAPALPRSEKLTRPLAS